MLRKSKFALLTLVLILALAPAAFAGLSAVGPVNPVNNPPGGTVPAPYGPNGFPKWYTDANGVSVDLPDPPIGAPPPTIVIPSMIFSAVTTDAYSPQTGFGAEAFYFNAVSDKNFQTKWGKVTVLCGLEASYANLIPTAGQQTVFARIRITAPKIQVAGTYTFSHPWGVETINVTNADLSQNGGKGIKFTKDVGVGAGWITNADGTFTLVGSPLGFYQVLQAGNTMSTFLRAVAPAPPAGWIGDGVTSTTFTGSPIGYNQIRLDAPAGTDLDGRGNSFIASPNMVISGHIPVSTTTPMPLSVDRITCSHAGIVENIDFWITSKPGAVIAINDVNPVNLNLGALLYTNTVTDPSGKFSATFPGTSKLVAITVTDPTGVFSPASKTVAVIDYVNIISAVYGQTLSTLNVQATSSDYFFTTKRNLPPPVLTVAGFGTMTIIDAVNGIYALSAPVTNRALLPPNITVTSSVGGTATVATAIGP